MTAIMCSYNASAHVIIFEQSTLKVVRNVQQGQKYLALQGLIQDYYEGGGWLLLWGLA